MQATMQICKLHRTFIHSKLPHNFYKGGSEVPLEEGLIRISNNDVFIDVNFVQFSGEKTWNSLEINILENFPIN